MKQSTDAFDKSRIRHLVGDAAQSSPILIVGLGSGGFPVMQHLAMSGWHRFILLDPDRLGGENLAKHPGKRADVGRFKVDVAEEWLLDRNPKCAVEAHPDDIFEMPEAKLEDLLLKSSLVIVGTDNNESRYYLNDLCVKLSKKMVMGLVHRGGRGGTVFIYRPEIPNAGCYSCMEIVARGLDSLPSEASPPLSAIEEGAIYGRQDVKYGLAGLSSDIAIVAAIHASASVGELLSSEQEQRSDLDLSPTNWIAVGMRQTDFSALVIKSIELPSVDGCNSCLKRSR